MLTIVYVISLSLIAQVVCLQANTSPPTPREILTAINTYEQERALQATLNKTQSETSTLYGIDQQKLTRLKVACLSALALEQIAYISQHFISLLLMSFSHAALGGDVFTGNDFIEGRSEEALVALKLNNVLIDEQDVSLHELFDVFERLQEDLRDRAHYLDNRADKAEILTTLKLRKQRLMNNLHGLENHLFHFRRHPSLHKYQYRAAYVCTALATILGGLWLAASYDLETNSWHEAMSDQMQKNMQFLKTKLIS